MALRGTPGALSVQWPRFSCSTAVFRRFFSGHASDALRPKCVILFSDVTLLKGAVTSQHHTCIGHVTFYYKRVCQCLGGGGGGGFLPVVCPFIRFDSYHQRPTCGWCLTRVGHDASSASLGWSLLPSKVIIVLTLVNSTMSPVGTQVSQRDPGVPLYSC